MDIEKRREYNREYKREYYKRPEIAEKRRQYRSLPVNKAKRNAYNKEHPEIVIKQRIRTYKNFLEKHGYKVIGMEDEA